MGLFDSLKKLGQDIEKEIWEMATGERRWRKSRSIMIDYLSK